MQTSWGQLGVTQTSRGQPGGTPGMPTTPSPGVGSSMHAPTPSATPSTTLGMSPTGVPPAGTPPPPWSPVNQSPGRASAGVRWGPGLVTPRTSLLTGALPASLRRFTVAAWAQIQTDQWLKGCLDLQGTCLLVRAPSRIILFGVADHVFLYCVVSHSRRVTSPLCIPGSILDSFLGELVTSNNCAIECA